MKVAGWSTNMQSLVVQALVMRQLGRLNPRHLVAAGFGLRHAEWCPRTIHTRQVWGSAVVPALTCQRPASRSRDALRGWAVHHLRFKSNKKQGYSRTGKVEEEEEDENKAEDSDYEEEVDEARKDYKDLKKHVQSFRFDVIMNAGLDAARNNIEDAFYSSKLRLNGHRLIKKSKTIKVGDILDLVLDENEDTVTLKRVVLKKANPGVTGSEKHKVELRRWKFLQLSKDEALKS